MSAARHIATLGGLGYIGPASGTLGSLVALPLAWLLHVIGGPYLLIFGTVLAIGIGWWATAIETAGRTDHDPSEIIIDELAGQWIALWPLSIGAAYVGVSITNLWPGWLAGFVLFRLFDIWKPGPIGWADRRGDALGVMLDDLIAGLFAALGVVAMAGLAHGGMAL